MWFFQATISAAESVTLTWNPSTDLSVVGYKIYYGAASHSYSSVVTVANTNSVTIPGLIVGEAYYFAATAYNSAGVESDLSNEASYTVPTSAAMLTSAIASGGEFSFAVSGNAGQLYVVQASTNLRDWISIQTNAAPFSFVDTTAAGFQQRFFRTVSPVP